MNKEIRKEDFDILCGLFEHRVSRFFELMEIKSKEVKRSAEEFSSRLTEIERSICEHEINRRKLLLERAAEMIKEQVGDPESILSGQHGGAVLSDSDEDVIFDDLKKAIESVANPISPTQIGFKRLSAARSNRESLKEKYSTAVRWALSDSIKRESDKKIEKIVATSERIVKSFSDAASFQYSKIIDPLQKVLGLVCSGEASIEDVIKQQKEANAEFDSLAKRSTSCRYGLDSDERSIRIDIADRSVVFLASAIEGNIIIGYPYPKSDMDEIIAQSFPEYVTVPCNETVEDKQILKCCKHIYPIMVSGDYFLVLQECEQSTNIVDDSVKYESDPRIEDSVLFIDRLDSHDYDNVVFVSCAEKPIHSFDDIAENPSARVVWYTRSLTDPAPFRIPLSVGKHHITIFGISESGMQAYSLPYRFVGDQVALKYTVSEPVKAKVRSMLSHQTVVTVRFQIESNPVFEKLNDSLLPPMVACIGSPAPLKIEDGEATYNIPAVELTKTQSGSYSASVDVTIPRTDLSVYTVKVFFKKPNTIFQLRDVRRVK